MTWREFKAKVEAEGVSNDMTIEAIDVILPFDTYESTVVDVYINTATNSFTVTN